MSKKNVLNKSIENIYPLTPLQEGMLFHVLSNPKSTNYVLQTTYLLKFSVNSEIMFKAVAALSERYDVLRTAILYEKLAKPRQVVMKKRIPEYSFYDYSIMTVKEQESVVSELQESQVQRGFDMQKDTLLRICCVKLSENCCKLIWTMHHIIVDGWCMSILFAELMRYYRMFADDYSDEQIYRIVANEKLSTGTFAQYVKWIGEQDVKKGLDYWEDYLKCLDNIADIRPVEQPRETVVQMKRTGIRISDIACQSIMKLSKEKQITVSTVLETGWGLLLQRYNNCNDVVFGKVVSGRNVPVRGVEKIIGIFANTIPCRVRSQKNETFLSLLEKQQKLDIECSDITYCSLADIQKRIHCPDLIKTLFVFENYYVVDDSENDGNRKYEQVSGREQTNYGISISAYSDDDGVGIDLMYDPSQFTDDNISLILRHYKGIVEDIALNSNKYVGDLLFIGEEETNMLLHVFNDTAKDFPYNIIPIDLFEEQVLETPDDIAIVSKDVRMTYSELNLKANQLAYKLRAVGVSPDTFVGIVVKRSPELIISILATLKAGGAYVPIDYRYPETRIKYMLDDCTPSAVLVHGTSIDTNAPVIDLADADIWNGYFENPEHVSGPENLAYLIYTSGTTGNPKGVMIENHSLVNHLMVANDAFYHSRKSVTPLYTSHCFDFSIPSIFVPLTTGGAVSIFEEKDDAILDVIRDQNISVIKATPSVLRAALGSVETKLSSKLLTVITAGETLTEDVVRITRQALNDNVEFFNDYGPTEATVFCTLYKIDNPGCKIIPIGRPVYNTQIYILQGTQLCGIGEPGELCIAGVGIARGYLNRPELTASKFIRNPFGKGRLYRTGDLARWLSDGNIEYLGRIDEQVKIRGFRVELGEIENVLLKQPDIVNCAVIARTNAEGEKALYAYFVGTKELDTEEIRGNIQKVLPDYMVPSYMLQLDSIPVTKNGKLDKRALPEIFTGICKNYIAPRNDREALICNIFSGILGVKQVGIRDSFFSLGGHSLRAISLINQIYAKTESRLSVRDVFTNQTPEQLAMLLDSAEGYVPIPNAKEREYYPMSSQQKRMYLTCKMDSHSISYNILQKLYFYGEIIAKRLQQAFQEMVDRYEILRTEFLMVNGEPVQRIIPHIEADFTSIEDYENSDEALAAAFNQPFDLGRAPLIRAKLVKRKSYYMLMLNMHHIISDAVSENLFFSELSALYNGEKLGRPIHQYKDYSEWMLTRDMSEQKKYWCSQFNDELPVLDMPLDFSRPKTQSSQGRFIVKSIDEELCKKVKLLAKGNGATEYMVFLSAAMILLSKYSRQNDIIIGSPISGRAHQDTENMLGMFINTLAMRGRPEGQKDYREFLKEIRESCLKAYENQEYPFDELVDAVNVQRDSSRNPMFDVMLVVQNSEQSVYSFDGIRAEMKYTENNTSKFDLTFMFEEKGRGYQLGLEYCSELFTSNTAWCLIKHYIAVLEQLTENSNRKISDIEVITAEEKSLILNSFNDSAAEYPENETLVSLFEAQAEKTPDNIALEYLGQCLTYAELNARANQIAHRIRSMGIMPDDFVAILAERSIEMVVAIYGILKAGGAYVPINTSYPAERIQFILEDCEAKCILTNLDKLPIDTNIVTICLDAQEFESESMDNCEIVNSPADIAYVIYTSGTTGKPKGVMIEHRNVVRLFANSHFQYDFDEKDVWIMFHSYGFDFSVWEMYGATLFGGRLIVVPTNVTQDSKLLLSLIRDSGVTVLNQVPSSFYNLQRCCEKREDLSVRYLIFGGEALDPAQLKCWHEWYPGCKIVNMYGITETTVHATYREIGATEISQGISNIGNAIPTLQIYIRNDNNLCGIGVPGEICVAGAGLARGYLNRPELNAEKFIPNPYGEGRLYRSGDLARWLPDGSIEYLGRIDEQVKIRGFRIELGEIVCHLHRIETVKDCAVIVREDRGGEKAIYAYVVGEKKLDLEKIRDELRKDVPEYMLPAYMMQIEALPVTKNGKLDRHALPEIDCQSTDEYQPPQNENEELICDTFKEILGLERVGVNDSFFENGGHSLRAAWLANRIEEKTGCRVALRDIFGNQTPKQLALLISENIAYVSIPQAAEQEYYPMSSAQKRMYLMCQMDSRGVSYNVLQSYHLKGEVSAEKLRNAMQVLIDRHEILRTEFLMVEGELVQKILPIVEADFTVIDDAETSERVLAKAFVKPFDLGKVPLVRAELVKRNDGYLFMFDMHHIVSDGMSEEIFIQELAALYNGEELEALTHQYKDYSEWMRTRDISGQKEYWLSQFEGEIPVLDMPLDYMRPQVQSYSGAIILENISDNLGSKIKKLAHDNDATEYMIFLSAAMILLSRYSRQDDIVIGCPISGRTHSDTEKMLGMFVNTLAMRGHPEKNKKYTDFLSEIRETCLKAYENQEYPFEELVEAVDVQRDMSRNPLFDVVLVLQNNEQSDVCLNGTETELVIPEESVAKFDLTFNIGVNGEGYLIAFEYCSDLFSEGTAKQLLKHYIVVLEELTENCNCRISDIRMLAKDEEELILGRFNDTAMPYSEEGTIVSLFEEQAAKAPEKTAVVFENERLTYAMLNARANQVAHKLRSLGVGPDDFVVLVAERGIEMLAGIYGIMKAGGAYVPMDPMHPRDRIQYMIEDCIPKAVLVYHAEVDTELPVIDLAGDELTCENTENPERVNKPADLAYCIYTSGTTGKPKGVMVEHHGVVNLQAYFAADFQVTAKDRILQFANDVFDASVWEMNMALLNGATLVISTDNIDIKAFEQRFRDEEITVATLPPNFYALLNDINPRLLITAGSASSHDIINKAKGLRYINAYGPTETTVCATHWEYKGDDSVISIGKPIRNTRVYILNGMELCGIGVPGELCVAGAGIARGYLNRPELTAEKFIENPFGTGRLYRTGDLARWLPDGNIEFLGRIDEQVKIRGFRVELGEIESTLRTIPSVKDCTVIVREDNGQGKAIYAYIVSEEELDLDIIREKLRSILPEYMVPAYMMQIDNIPVTRSGKVDRRALPIIREGSSKRYVAACSEEEILVCKTMSEILGVDQIGIYDNFYALGGDSIKAIRVTSRFRELGFTLSVKNIMQSTSIGELAEMLVAVGDSDFEQGEVTGYIKDTPIIKVFKKWNFIRPEYFNQAVMLETDASIDQIRNSLDALVRHHDVLRSVYSNQQLRILPYSEGKHYDFASYDLSDCTDAPKCAEEICSNIQSRINLENGPLMKVALFQTENGSQMMVCIHHLVVDNVSWHILIDDFNTAIRQQKQGKSIKLPAKTASFIDWANALEAYRSSETLLKEKQYWEKVNAAIDQNLFRITNEIRGKEYTVRISLDERYTQRLLYEAGNAYNTQPQDILLAALGRAVEKVSGQKKVSVCLEGHGREMLTTAIDVDRTVGWFTSIYPVILESYEAIEDMVINIKEMLRKVPNHGFGYQFITDIAHCTDANIYFNYLGENNYADSESELFSVGKCIADENCLVGDIQFNGDITNGILSFDVGCRQGTCSEEVISTLAECYKATLCEIIDCCSMQGEKLRTLSDLDDDELDDDDLDIISGLLGLE